MCARGAQSITRKKSVRTTDVNQQQATTTVVAATNERTNKRNEGRKEGTLHKESLTEGRKERKHTRTMPWTNRKKMSVMQCNQSTNQSVSQWSVGRLVIGQSVTKWLCVSAWWIDCVVLMKDERRKKGERRKKRLASVKV